MEFRSLNNPFPWRLSLKPSHTNNNMRKLYLTFPYSFDDNRIVLSQSVNFLYANIRMTSGMCDKLAKWKHHPWNLFLPVENGCLKYIFKILSSICRHRFPNHIDRLFSFKMPRVSCFGTPVTLRLNKTWSRKYWSRVKNLFTLFFWLKGIIFSAVKLYCFNVHRTSSYFRPKFTCKVAKIVSCAVWINLVLMEQF